MRGWRAILLTSVSAVVLALAGLAFTYRAVPIYGAAEARAEMPAASMPPSIPSSFYGEVKVNGQNVMAGTLITVRSNGVVYAYTASLMWEGLGSVYSIDVPADNLDTPDRDGGVLSDTLRFTVGGLLAEQTATWDNTIPPQTLNLTASALRFYLPLIVR